MKSILLVLLIIIIVIVNVALMLNNKYSMKAFLISVGIFIGYIFTIQLICGPSPIDVYRMRLMAKPINTYLITKGKPKSLDSIPNLPYELKCSSPYSCSFEKSERVYKVWLERGPGGKVYSLKLYSSKSSTNMFFWYKHKNNQFIKDGNPYIYSNKKTGICSSIKQ